MTDLLHSHLTIGLEPVGVCPACDQVHVALPESVTDVPEGPALSLVG